LDKLEKTTHKDFPRFSELIHVYASPQIKHGATLVGNLVNGSPIGDSLPFLIVSNALVHVISVRGPRSIPMAQFYTGYRQTALAGDEIVTSIEIPKSKGDFYLYKVCNRKDLDISVVTFALHFYREASKLKGVRFALGGVGPTVRRFAEVEALLEGQVWTEALVMTAAKKSLELIKPLSDVRGSSEYRNILVRNFWKKMSRDFSGMNVNV
jgi:xanthine dehydrogenase small subunit